ncbi:MAG: NAD(P)H-hydrate dehydratase [Oscillospiraceae bacterium]|nr:NAD(P)H-hydrate dehydratase [Oscillospiraceae bacterium]
MPIHLNDETALALIPERNPDSHKGDYGKILLLCGSRGFTGAAALAALGALRSGAGLVYLGVPESIYAIEAVKLTEPVVMPLPDREGMLSEEAIEPIRTLLPKMDAVLFGCGSGLGQGPEAVLKMLLTEAQCPLILDADGITLVSRHKDILRDRQYPTILTPHEGELARLAPPAGERVASSEAFARELGAILLRKGHRTVITDGYKTYVNQSGNPGMAVGGSGDVLAGIILSFLGQKVPPLQAAACGAWFHGRAGDLAAEKLGMRGLLPTDMVVVLPRLLK